jgi:hypothetical protein
MLSKSLRRIKSTKQGGSQKQAPHGGHPSPKLTRQYLRYDRTAAPISIRRWLKHLGAPRSTMNVMREGIVD